MDDHVSNNLVFLLNTLKSPKHNNCWLTVLNILMLITTLGACISQVSFKSDFTTYK